MLGDEATVGKSLGTDLLKQKSTLPLIRLFDQAAPADRGEVFALWPVRAIIAGDATSSWDRYDALHYTREKAVAYAQRAAASSRLVPPCPAVDALTRLADFVVRRDR